MFMSLALYSMIFASLNACIFFHHEMLHGVLRSSMRYFESTPVGRIVNRFSKDISVIDTNLPSNLRLAFEFFLGFACILFVILSEMPIMVVGIIPLMVGFYGIQVKFQFSIF